MKRLIVSAVLTAATIAVFAEPSSDAARAQMIASQNGCMSCHRVNRRIVGPAFREIAAKYQHDPQALDGLVKKVKQGSSGVWGQLPMPAHPYMSDAQVQAIIHWVLAGAPTQ